MSTNNSQTAYSGAKANGALSALSATTIGIFAQHPNGLTINEACVEYFKLNPSAIRGISGAIVYLNQVGKLIIVASRGNESVYVLREKPSKLEKIARLVEREKQRAKEVQLKTIKLATELAKETNRLLGEGETQQAIDTKVSSFQAQFRSEKNK